MASDILELRYGDMSVDTDMPDPPQILETMLARGSCREFTEQVVAPETVTLLCAAALASPTKSDLQQRDIVLLRDPEVTARIIDLLQSQPWVRKAPHIAVFCGNNRRQRLLHSVRGHPFANDHLDAFFNAAVDAAMALSAFVTAADALGLGCCPISAVRNDAEAVSDLLGLPDHVFPVAGLAFGYPATPPQVSVRLPLAATVHEDRYREDDPARMIGAYDARRTALQPYGAQRAPEVFGQAEAYGWSEDKSRQYALPERHGFGAFVRRKGFDLT